MSEDKIYPSMVIRIQAEAIELLEQENKQLKEVIEEVREEIKDLLSHWKGNDLVERDLNELLEILDKAKGE